MSEKENSPRKLKQTTISGLWSSLTSSSALDSTSATKSKKRKVTQNPSGFPGSPNKKLSLDIDDGTDRENNDRAEVHEIHFEDLSFQDFENNPFLSPKKSPKKSGVLTENCCQSSDEFSWQHSGGDLSFEMPKCCRVIKTAAATSANFEQILLVRDEKTEETGLCRLRDAWTCSTISPGDCVVVQAARTADGWIVNNRVGYIVLHPSIVLSSTSLVKSLYCMRRSVLANFYKGLESGTNALMVVGRLVHELFQKSLRLGTCRDEDFTSFVSECLQTCDYLHDLYFSNLSFKEARQQVESFVPEIRNFLDVYVNKVSKPFGKNFSGSIEEVMDIEELVRSPFLGCQGRIDVTLRVRSNNRESVAPLELKTGRASFSAEHRCQLTLYILLLQELGRQVESGLLLYLKDGIMEEVVPTRDEVRNLFLLRNRLSGYLKTIKENELPEPIRSSSCMKCPYLRVCTSYLKTEYLYETHSLRSIQFEDIKPAHVEYFTLWNKLLWLEFGDADNEEADDTKISGLTLQSGAERVGNEFQYKFIFSKEAKTKSFKAGTFVQICKNRSSHVCSARIVSITSGSCILSTDVVLTETSEIYQIRAIKANFLHMYLGNLGLLLEERYKNLRDIIIDKQPSKFESKLDKKTFREKCLGKLMPLNKEQQRAVLKSITCNNYMLVKGPPGTGKTETIAAMVEVFLALGKKVLIAGHTNTSVDNVLLRLQSIEYLRLGSLRSINPKIHDRCYATLSKNCTTLQDMNDLYDRRLIASTCSGIDDNFLQKIRFDICIVDEGSQVLECEILRPLLCSDVFVLVGDEDQLPPVVQNPEASRLGMRRSLFERLEGDNTTVRLRFQYRMNSRINALANSIAYKGLIECGNEEIANATMKINLDDQLEGWLKDALSCALEDSVVFVDTSEYFSWKGVQAPEKPRSSRLEAKLVKKLVGTLISLGMDEDTLGVITTFGDQVCLLRETLGMEGWSRLELNTVDQYQGRDKEVIIFSCGKENQAGTAVSELELLNESKRLTVAVTRAKHKLILLGDRTTIEKYEPFRKLLDALADTHFVNLRNGKNGLDWTNYED